MEEICGAALAYYNNFSEEQKQQVFAAFRVMDTDGNGTVSLWEFEQTVVDDGVSRNKYRALFMELDTNGDGKLNFQEYITFYYIVISKRHVWCDGYQCRAFLKGLYFTCVDCLQSNSFDLCTSCYHNHNHIHPHSNFLDNYALLRFRTEIVSNQLQESSSVESRELVVRRSGYKIGIAASILSIGSSLFSIVETLGEACTIM